MAIPRVDCSGGVVSRSAELVSAIDDVGFVYLLNHGLSQATVTKALEAGDAFWTLPVKERAGWARRPGAASATGWVPEGAEALDPAQRRELRQAFDLVPPLRPEELPSQGGFSASVLALYRGAARLAGEVLVALGAGLAPARPECLAQAHAGLAGTEGTSILRLLHYPPVQEEAKLAEGTRCGEHTDYGTLTLLFQDDLPGLEVLGKDGEWMAADPVPGAVLVNAGDLLV